MNSVASTLLYMTDGTYERIVQAAIHEFAYHGFNVALTDISHRAGVSDVTLYRQFEDKEALQAAVFVQLAKDNPIGKYMHEVNAMANPPPFSEVVGCLCELAIGAASDHLRIVYFAALQRPDILKTWEGTARDERTYELLLVYIDKMRKLKRPLPRLKREWLAKVMLGAIFGAFSRDHLLRDTHVADDEPLAPVLAILRLIEGASNT